MPRNVVAQFEVDFGRVVDRLEGVRADDVPDWRRRLVENVARDVLQSTVSANPVDTGRSRSAWIGSLEQLGGSPPPGWRGPHPDSEAISEGRDSGAQSMSDSFTQTEIQTTNGVSYVGLLEFGSRAMAPFAMVGRSLAQVVGRVSQFAPALFRLR